MRWVAVRQHSYPTHPTYFQTLRICPLTAPLGGQSQPDHYGFRFRIMIENFVAHFAAPT